MCEEVESDEGQGGCVRSGEIRSAGNNCLREVLREHGVPSGDGGGQIFSTYCQNFSDFSLIQDPFLEQNAGCGINHGNQLDGESGSELAVCHGVPGEQLQCQLGPERGKWDLSCLRMLCLPRFLLHLCEASSGKPGQDRKGKQLWRQDPTWTQGTSARRGVKISGLCLGLQGELSFDEPFMPVPAQAVDMQNDRCMHGDDQVVEAALSQDNRGSNYGLVICPWGFKRFESPRYKKGPSRHGGTA